MQNAQAFIHCLCENCKIVEYVDHMNKEIKIYH